MNDKKLLRILNCPKCRNKGYLLHSSTSQNSYIVECSVCHMNYNNYRDTPENAIRAWNTEVYIELTKK